MWFRSNFVRHELPLWVSCFHLVLPHVRGFPTLRVLRLIRLRCRLRSLPPLQVPFPTIDSGQVCGVCRKRQVPCVFALVMERLRPPKFLGASLHACHGLITPPVLLILTMTDDLVLPSVYVTTLGDRECISKRYQHFRERGLPGACPGLDPGACMILCVRFVRLVRRYFSSNSATDATLNTGDWLGLARQGLSPCKMHQAYLGALTLIKGDKKLCFNFASGTFCY